MAPQGQRIAAIDLVAMAQNNPPASPVELEIDGDRWRFDYVPKEPEGTAYEVRRYLAQAEAYTQDTHYVLVRNLADSLTAIVHPPSPDARPLSHHLFEDSTGVLAYVGPPNHESPPLHE